MKSKFLTLLCSFLVLFSVNAHAFTLNDATSFDPIPVQVQAASIGVPVGTVIVWTKEEIPEGWLECNGQPVPDIYPDLKALMPTVPDYQGRFLQGKDISTSINQRIEAGLPEIWGNFNNIIATGAYPPTASGAFSITHTGGGPWSDGGWKLSGVNFRASKVSSVYGNSETVQPPSVTVKYLIKAE